jgi:hypothetical protein
MSTVLRPPEGGVALQLYEQGLNTIFLFVAVSVAYGMVSALRCSVADLLPIKAAA